MGTVLPFSTSGGRSSSTRPLRISASPTTMRIAVSIWPSATACFGNAAPTAATAPAFKPSRRVIVTRYILILQRHQISHHILDLLRGQDRLAAKTCRHTIETIGPIVGRHDGLRIDLRRIHDPQPQLSFRPTRTGPFQVR